MYRAFWPLAAFLMILPAVPLGAAHDTGLFIRPGDFIQSDGLGCTLGWFFDGATEENEGTIYASTAAHCVTRVGRPVTVDGHGAFATVVARGWGTSSSGARSTDYALLEVDASHYGRLRDAVEGHPYVPNGVTTTSEVGMGDNIGNSGWGLGFEATAETRQLRPGVLTYHTNRVWGAITPMIFGDSGGPVFHEDGRAIGWVSGPDPVVHSGNGFTNAGYEVRGATVEGVIEQLADNWDIAVTLRTAPFEGVARTIPGIVANEIENRAPNPPQPPE